jgi:hypothetical protein
MQNQNKKVLKLILEEMKNLDRIITFTHKSPQLKQILVSLLSPKYIHFINDIQLKAPKPTTFQVVLANDFTFLLTYIGKNAFQAKISGKQYNLTVAGEIDRASKAITDLLVLKKPLSAIEAPMQEPTGTEGVEGGGQPDFTPPTSEPTNSVFNPLAPEEAEQEENQ